jgi:D-threo-aldose 1-dehydrogenase
MEQIALGDTGRLTSRLGFGCSSLMGASGRRASLALLESAFDAGIRHFDVAPMYGYGEAESCLGEFLQRHRTEVTIATKYGIPPAKKSSVISLGRRIAGPIVKTFPGLKQRLASAANAATHNPERATFTPTEAKASLERSLAALRADRIDLWLLHEASAADLDDDALLELLEDEVKKGTIGTFGVGSEAAKIPALLAKHPDYCRTLQYEWSVLDRSIDSSSDIAAGEATPLSGRRHFRIHHRALTTNFRAVHRTLTHDKQLCQRWSASTHADLSNSGGLAGLMLKASLVMNPNSVVLFSSKNAMHIKANALIAQDKSLDEAALHLYELVQGDRDQLLIAGAETN